MKRISPADLENAELYPLFFQKSYAQFETTRGWQVVLIVDSEGTVIPLKTRKSRFIKQAQYLYPPLKNGNRLSAEAEKQFLENMLSFCRNDGVCDFIMPPLHFSLFQAVPSGSYYTDLGIVVIDLNKPEEEIFKSFNESYRNKIRKAVSSGVTVQFDNKRFDDFYSLYRDTHQRQGVYYDPERDVKNMVESLGESNCCIAIAGKGKDIYGSALALFSAEEAYYYQGGSRDGCPYPGANKVLQFETMKWLKKTGMKRYCLGGFRLGDVSGTKYDGLQKFKMRFDANVEKGYHFYSTITWKYSLYKFMLDIYLKLRGVQQNTTGLNYRWMK